MNPYKVTQYVALCIVWSSIIWPLPGSGVISIRL
jgi:hypothetical protein